MSSILIVGGIVLFVIVLAVRALGKPGGGRTFRGGPGAGATGAVYDMLNEDKRRAIEIIVEGRAEMTDPETADDVPRNDGNDGNDGNDANDGNDGNDANDANDGLRRASGRAGIGARQPTK